MTGTVYISDDLRDLTETLSRLGMETDGGILGGDFGYGCEFSNSVFEMHQFWWGDCTCGFETLDWQWSEDVPHLEDCYQAEVSKIGSRNTQDLARSWNLPSDFGSAVHCTCGRVEAYREWRKANDHSKACPIVRPNFRHSASGVEVRWYKYIGRGMEVFNLIDKKQWRRIITECESSVAA